MSGAFMNGDAGVPAEHGFTAHTPDPNKYHSLGNRTMLPRSKGTYQNHQSRGFHHEDKGKVFVDPSDPTTGEGATAVIDFASLTEDQVQAAISQEGNANDVMHKLAEMQKAEKSAPANPVPQTLSLPPMPAPSAPVLNGQSLPNTVATFPAYIPPQAVPTAQEGVSPNFERMMAELLSRLPPQPVKEATPLPPAEPTYTEAQIRETFGLPYLSMEWQPPTVQAIFGTQAGVIQALYHAVTRHDRRITLVVDSRQPSQLLFIPAITQDRGELPIRITVPSLKIDEHVYNPDFRSSHGVYDHYDLVVVDEKDEEPDDDA